MDVDGIEAQLISEWDEDLHETQLRLACLNQAYSIARDAETRHGETVHETWRLGEQIYRWVTKRVPASIRIVTVGGVTRQQQEESPMQIHDDEQFTLAIEVDDAKGFAIQGDQVTVTVDDESVVTVQSDAPGSTSYTVVAGNPGSAVITFDAGTDDQGNQVTVTEAVDVVAGGVATIKITEGEVTKQGAAPEPTPGV